MELRLMDKVGVEHMPCEDKVFTAFMESQNPILRPPSELRLFDPADLPPQLYLHACVSEFLLTISRFRALSSARNNYNSDNPTLVSLRYPSTECFSVRST